MVTMPTLALCACRFELLKCHHLISAMRAFAATYSFNRSKFSRSDLSPVLTSASQLRNSINLRSLLQADTVSIVHLLNAICLSWLGEPDTNTIARIGAKSQGEALILRKSGIFTRYTTVGLCLYYQRMKIIKRILLPQIIEKYRAGVTFRRIALDVGRSPDTISRWCRQYDAGMLHEEYGLPAPQKQDAPDIPKGGRGDKGKGSVPE